MIRNLLTNESVLLGCEQTLYIEHNEREVRRIVEQSISTLEAQLGMQLNRQISDILADEIISTHTLEVFLQQVAEQLKSIALLNALTIYDRKYTFHLREYNYLGFDQSSCLAALKYLSDAELYKSKDTFWEAFIRSADRLNVCEVKRWLVIMSVFERLGIAEGVSMIAQYMYISSTLRS